MIPAFSGNGKRSINEEHEEEAKWLGPALLVSEEAALRIARGKIPIDAVAAEFGVSAALLRMRLNVTGAQKRAARRRR